MLSLLVINKDPANTMTASVALTGFIPDATSAANPHGLPIGLTTVHSRDRSHTEEVVRGNARAVMMELK